MVFLLGPFDVIVYINGLEEALLPSPEPSNIGIEMATRIAAAATVILATLFFSAAISAANFDFFYYAVMWPGAYCRQSRGGCCLPTTGEPEIDFFVKGLYPYKNRGNPVTKCNSTHTFHINEVKELMSDMYAYWPNIKCPSNNGLSNWKHVWKTYGTCSGFTAKEYFNKTMQLHSKLNLLSKLKRAEIVPTNEVYSSAYVEAAINDIVGQKVGVRCGQAIDMDMGMGRGGYQLYEIWVCVAKDGSTIIPCPVIPRFTCGQKMKFTSFTYDMMKDTSISFDPNYQEENEKIIMPITTPPRPSTHVLI
ncbi:hypothetical protein ACLOJK_019941 [Asimina triloba]